MTILKQRALARLPLTEAEVEMIYSGAICEDPSKDLCESHERLRAELEGLDILLAESEAEIDRLRKQLSAVKLPGEGMLTDP